MIITSQDQLRALYGEPNERAVNKVLGGFDKHVLHFISLSPFLAISTIDADGNLDVSPRGGEPGFVKVIGNNELLIHDAKGNKRVDSLSNIVDTGFIGTLFFIPGVDEALRINGRATVSVDPTHLSLFEREANPPKSCIHLVATQVFLHCAKALMRSKLWSAESQIERSILPTMGEMMKDHLKLDTEPESREEMLKRYAPDL